MKMIDLRFRRPADLEALLLMKLLMKLLPVAKGVAYDFIYESGLQSISVSGILAPQIATTPHPDNRIGGR